MKYIFHVHTEYSHDSDVKLKSLYKALKKRKIDGIAITDHNEINGAIEFKKLYGREIDVIIGEEIMTSRGEIIGLFLKEKIVPGLTPEETIKNIKNQNGIVYIPHPYDEKRSKTCLDLKYIFKFREHIDCIEVFNGRCIKEIFNEEALKIANKIKANKIIGADAHTIMELRYNSVIVEQNLNSKNFIENLKLAKFKNKKINLRVHQITKFVRIKKMMEKGDYSAIFKLINKKCSRRLSKNS